MKKAYFFKVDIHEDADIITWLNEQENRNASILEAIRLRKLASGYFFEAIKSLQKAWESVERSIGALIN